MPLRYNIVAKQYCWQKKEQENQTTEYHTYLHTLPTASTLLHRIRAIPLLVGIYRFYSPDPFFRGILTPASRQDQIPFLGYSFFNSFSTSLFVKNSFLSPLYVRRICIGTAHAAWPSASYDTTDPSGIDSNPMLRSPMCRFSCAEKRFPALYVDEAEKAAAVRQEAPKHLLPSRGVSSSIPGCRFCWMRLTNLVPGLYTVGKNHQQDALLTCH